MFKYSLQVKNIQFITDILKNMKDHRRTSICIDKCIAYMMLENLSGLIKLFCSETSGLFNKKEQHLVTDAVPL